MVSRYRSTAEDRISLLRVGRTPTRFAWLPFCSIPKCLRTPPALDTKSERGCPVYLRDPGSRHRFVIGLPKA